MEDGVIVAIVIAGALQLVLWIVFFVMAWNISTIRREVSYSHEKASQYLEMAKEEIYIGNKEKAKEYLLRARMQCENRELVYLGRGDDQLFRGEKAVEKIDEMLAGLLDNNKS